MGEFIFLSIKICTASRSYCFSVDNSLVPVADNHLERRDYQKRVLQTERIYRDWFEDNGYKLEADAMLDTDEAYSITDMDVLEHVKDYNRGVLLPFTPISHIECKSSESDPTQILSHRITSSSAKQRALLFYLRFGCKRNLGLHW